MSVTDALWQFFGGVFHQDVWNEFSTADAAVEDFRRRSFGDVDDVVRGLDNLLALGLDDSSLARKLEDDYGFRYYNPHVDGLTYEQWLRHVRDLLTESP